jgi:hypothetical protein
LWLTPLPKFFYGHFRKKGFAQNILGEIGHFGRQFWQNWVQNWHFERQFETKMSVLGEIITN